MATDEQTTYVPANTKDAYFAVMYHVGVKGLQAGTLLGMTVWAPVAWLLVGRRNGRSLMSYVRSEGVRVHDAAATSSR